MKVPIDFDGTTDAINILVVRSFTQILGNVCPGCLLAQKSEVKMDFWKYMLPFVPLVWHLFATSSDAMAAPIAEGDLVRSRPQRFCIIYVDLTPTSSSDSSPANSGTSSNSSPENFER